VSRELLQDLGKVDLIMADPHECNCSEDTCILRTELKIPNTLQLAARDHGITFVGMYGGMAWQETTWQAGPWTTFSKYTGEKTKWFLKGDYIYILNPEDPMLSYMNIQGLFEDPKEASEFVDCDCDDDTEDCDEGFDFEYPIPAHMIDTLVKMVMDAELRWTTLLPEDTANNSRDEN
jgi:hypothetical protein